MAKIQFSSKLFALPTTQMILGTHLDNKPTFMALAWATRVNFQPPLIAIGVNKSNKSHEALSESGEFSLSMPSTDMVEITDYVGLVSARKVDKSSLFDLFYGDLKSAPLIGNCPLSLALKLYKSVDMPTNTLFIGEVVEAWCEESLLQDGRPDMTKLDPFILTMPDNQYWRLGEKVGDAWKSGKALKK